MKYITSIFIAIFLLSGCNSPDIKEDVDGSWDKGGEYITIKYSLNNDTQYYTFRCSEHTVIAPFDYFWDGKCNFAVQLSNYAVLINQPHPENFYSRQYEGSVGEAMEN